MRKALFFILVSLVPSFFIFADEEPVKRLCFDFSKAVTIPLKTPIPLVKDQENFDQGVAPNGIHWAAGRALVDLSPQAIYAWLLDHRNWKDPSKTTLTLGKFPNPAYLEFHRLGVDAHVFPFVTLHWVEEWAYRLTKGSKNNPKAFLASYQYVEGTGYITHLCGSVWVREVSHDKSDVFLYEEAKADYYESKNIHDLHVRNFYNLRQLATSQPVVAIETK